MRLAGQCGQLPPSLSSKTRQTQLAGNSLNLREKSENNEMFRHRSQCARRASCNVPVESVYQGGDNSNVSGCSKKSIFLIRTKQLRNLFCDRNPDCSDGSDENICSVTEDPNRFFFCKIPAFRNLKPELHLATREHVGCQNAFVHPTEQGALN